MQFAVTAIQSMQTATLLVDASDAADARRQAEARGYAVVAVRARAWSGLASLRRAPRFALLQFNQSLLTLLRAGLSLIEAIETLAERESRADLRRVLDALRAQLLEGKTLSAALESQPAAFPALYVATVRANETSGALVEAIERYGLYRAQIDLVRKRVIAASVYPTLILAVGSLVILFLLLYVVPRFSQVFEDLGDRIPLMSRMLLDWGRFVHDHGLALLAGAVALAALLVWALLQKPLQAALGRRILALPRIGEYVRTYQLARFYRTLGMLLRGGMPILAAIDMTHGLLPLTLRGALAQARTDLGEGQSMSGAFERRGLTTAVALRMLRVGERTGQMGEMMERIAVFHDEDVAQAIDWFIRLFEPLLMIGIGIVIGAVVLLMYAPIFELAGSIQ